MLIYLFHFILFLFIIFLFIYFIYLIPFFKLYFIFISFYAAFCCGKLYVCRLCHDEQDTTHKIDRFKTQRMMCAFCKEMQPIAQVTNKRTKTNINKDKINIKKHKHTI
jgi:hypothetical protein